MPTRQLLGLLVAFVLATATRAQDVQVTPQMFGLGDNMNARTGEPSEVRVYPANSDGKTANRAAGLVWPRRGSEDKTQHKLEDKEVAVYHGAIDLSSRGPDGKPVTREFTAGVYGSVLASRPGYIAVQLADGNIVQYLHASTVRLRPGQEVTPETILGETGNVGTNGKPLAGMAIHLHVQVTNPQGKLLDPDQAILAGRAEKQDRSIKYVKPEWIDVGPTLIDGVRPKVTSDGVVKADAANKKAYYEGRRYEVWGTSVKEPKRYRPWSESFATRAQAQARLVEIRRDYGKGGLLETDPDGPMNLEIREVNTTAGQGEALPRPGRYTYLAITGKDRAEWDLTVAGNGAVAATINLNGKLHNVTGILRAEDGKVMASWNTAGSGLRDVGGVRKWHDITKNVSEWKAKR